ncbi:MAG: type II toxin-antitoxin system prevent-host-death family antitoxin [Deltaproteobacteria bacterium]|nr:type II toxin-antitoxin system prevent-host-death family antitoxin [Deltaproteobacteria bacterium]
MKKAAVVGVRELKAHLSSVLRRVGAGETLMVTDRSRPLALMVKAPRPGAGEILRLIAGTGRVAWSGGKPRGLLRAPRVKGTTIAAAVVEDRR